MKTPIENLNVGDLFSFSKKGAVHMLVRTGAAHIEYKSFNDGKIRTAYLRSVSEVFSRQEYDSLYEKKWFLSLD